jgi:hypothetical protein
MKARAKILVWSAVGDYLDKDCSAAGRWLLGIFRQAMIVANRWVSDCPVRIQDQIILCRNKFDAQAESEWRAEMLSERVSDEKPINNQSRFLNIT